MTPEKPRDVAADDSTCPEPERLAEYADGLLEPPARAAVEGHLAICARCRSAVAEAVQFRSYERDVSIDHTEPVDRTLDNVAPIRRQWVTRAAVALAAAAALVIAVRWLAPRAVPGARPELAELIAAAASQPTRFSEGRLTGGFTYAPPPSPNRGIIVPEPAPAIRLAAAAIADKASRNRTPENVAALGVAYLAVGDLDRAIASLQEAFDNSGNAAYASDLSAALLRRGLRDARSADLQAAVAAADRALAIDGSLLEARFNRALALASLPTPDASGLEDYARRDRGAWGDEARQRQGASRRRSIVFELVTDFISATNSVKVVPFIEGGQTLVSTQAKDFAANLYASDIRCSAAYIGERVMITAGHCFAEADGRRDSFDHLRWEITALLSNGSASGDCERPAQFHEGDDGTNRWDVALCAMSDSPAGKFEVVTNKAAPIAAGSDILLTGFGINRAEGIVKPGKRISVAVAKVVDADADGVTHACGPSVEFGDSGGGAYAYADATFKARYMVGVNSRKTGEPCSGSGKKTAFTSELTGLWSSSEFIAKWHEEFNRDICGIHLSASQTRCRNQPLPQTVLVR